LLPGGRRLLVVRLVIVHHDDAAGQQAQRGDQRKTLHGSFSVWGTSVYPGDTTPGGKLQ
jgi:hypothetical protein